MVSEQQIHYLDIDTRTEFRYLGWKIWSIQNTFVLAISISFIPIFFFSNTSLWKVGYFLVSILRIIFSLFLFLDLVAIALIGASVAYNQKFSSLNILEKRFLGLVGFWLFFASIIRMILFEANISTPLTEIDFYSKYLSLLSDTGFLIVWVISNILLIILLVVDSQINPLEIRKGFFEDHRSKFGLFSLLPVLILLLGNVFLDSLSSFALFEEYGSSLIYLVFGLVVSKYIITPVLGKQAGRIEIIQIFKSKVRTSEGDPRRPIIINMRKTKYLKNTKKVRNAIMIIGIFLIIFPFSPFFITSMYKGPEVSVTIHRQYSDNDALNTLLYIEGLPLNSITSITSEHIMTNNTLNNKLNLIEESANIDFTYLLRSSPKTISLYWDVNIINLGDVLLDTSIVGDYWYSQSYDRLNDYATIFIYWVDGNRYGNLEAFNSSEPYAEWLYKGEFNWITNSGSFFGGRAVYVAQLLFLDDNFEPVCFIFRERGGGSFYI
ncbi:MAG: hypothetical protein ACXABU_07635 [Candidatus Hodarchaeales archaeon]